ncbi:hypothetical protein WDW89_03685 [Deltaproteobacteria bacterium TL4]
MKMLKIFLLGILCLVLSVNVLYAESTTAEPAAEPVTAESSSEPAVVEPVVAEPVTEPSSITPAAAEPVVAEPVTAEPVAAEPAVIEPIAVESVVAEPAAAEPANKSSETPPVSTREPLKTIMGFNVNFIIEVFVGLLYEENYKEMLQNISAIQSHSMMLKKATLGENIAERKIFYSYVIRLELYIEELFNTILKIQRVKQIHEQETATLRVVAAEYLGLVIRTCVECHSQFKTSIPYSHLVPQK